MGSFRNNISSQQTERRFGRSRILTALLPTHITRGSYFSTKEGPSNEGFLTHSRTKLLNTGTLDFFDTEFFPFPNTFSLWTLVGGAQDRTRNLFRTGFLGPPLRTGRTGPERGPNSDRRLVLPPIFPEPTPAIFSRGPDGFRDGGSHIISLGGVGPICSQLPCLQDLIRPDLSGTSNNIILDHLDRTERRPTEFSCPNQFGRLSNRRSGTIARFPKGQVFSNKVFPIFYNSWRTLSFWHRALV